MKDNMETKEVKQKVCHHCGSTYTPIKRGLHNWKNLFRKPSVDDLITLFIIVMILFAMWAYKHDIAECQKCLQADYEAWKNYSEGHKNSSSYFNYDDINVSLFNISFSISYYDKNGSE